jgi:hypothetical protein
MIRDWYLSCQHLKAIEFNRESGQLESRFPEYFLVIDRAA